MKRSILFLLLLPLMHIVPIMAQTGDSSKEKPTLFAVASVSSGDEDIFLGDSVMVTITVYSDLSFSSIKPKSAKTPSMKKCSVRRYKTGRMMSQNTAQYKGKRYYAVDADYFVVAPNDLGTFTFPSINYAVQLTERRSSDFFDPFGSFFDFGRSRSKTVDKECSSTQLKLKVVKRPPKTIDELRQKGSNVI